ncbi:hypothetical protein E2986_11258 [Frieseomelitta varia]|uniref:Tyrosine-protein phosphatase domain-containing protein n=1 Tax=Frieseomelitta varia TaxID=561572 RepID=A0A833RT28_9HYME|nr:hypothetical protein E2986_11258 [Frieseomelitta varia]
MGRKRWLRGGSELLVLFILHHVILGDGDVGCLFSESLCDPRMETCYNDLAFGRCLPLYTDLNDEDYYQYNFNVDELELLRLQLERLQVDEYKWSHPYTQCIMQMILYNLRHRENYDLRLCQHLKQRTHFENKNEIDQARMPTIAIVKFTPNNDKFNSQFANELYYPPGTRNQYFPDALRDNEYPRSPYKGHLRETDSQLYKPRFYNSNTHNEYDSLTNEETYEENLDGSSSRKNPLTFDGIDERLSRTRRQPQIGRYLQSYDDNAMESIKDALEEEVSKKLSDLEFLINDKSEDYSDKKELEDEDLEYEKAFSGKYKPRKFGDATDENKLLLENVKRNSKNDYNSDDYDDLSDEEELPQKDSSPMDNGIYTEGGLVQTADKADIDTDDNAYGNLFADDLKELLRKHGLAGFKRGDVKKPGPLFSTNNYAFKTPSPSGNENRSDSIETEQNNDVLLNPYVKKEVGQQADSKSYNNVDLDHVYVEFQEPFHKWSDGEHVVEKTKLPAMLEVVRKTEMSSSMFGAIVTAGVVAAIAAAAITLVIARRHAKARAKLAGLATPDPEASKDYQDLCRARMHAKQPADKPESPRITSLTRENESNNLPSNRSSTSSWGEEPALSNMDISTGQMVLSYMEGHLKNKDRLDEEWAALCAYEVDPCSTEVAQNEENVKCNRPGAAIPYDHSRVILNDYANANNSDYINASTITDHDPRNPAYIATQGPLPETTADFWQLVWEQGSVVIVMLTRLTEEGVAMCHRYWPEEGSELYHIYEVHLVSEHFWCDDYLVRSFYLKNLRTGETRTVTQFHFLSWPENSVPHSIKALLEFRR